MFGRSRYSWSIRSDHSEPIEKRRPFREYWLNRQGGCGTNWWYDRLAWALAPGVTVCKYVYTHIYICINVYRRAWPTVLCISSLLSLLPPVKYLTLSHISNLPPRDVRAPCAARILTLNYSLVVQAETQAIYRLPIVNANSDNLTPYGSCRKTGR